MKSSKAINVARDQVVMMAVSLLALLVFCYFSGFSLLIPLLIFFFGLHLLFFTKSSLRLFLHLSLLLVLLMFGAHVLASYVGVSHYYLPIAAVPMLAILLFNNVQLALLMALMSAALGGLILGFDLPETLVFFLGGLAGAYKMRDARTRGVLLLAGVYVAFVQVACYLLVNPSINKDILLYILKPLAFSGVIAAFVVMASSKLFEVLFGEVTNFTLLELSDSSQPLLKRMVVEAPGSYHHSLIVSNLAEAAADSIGVNDLLARVGAYYHDVGKMVKPE